MMIKSRRLPYVPKLRIAFTLAAVLTVGGVACADFSDDAVPVHRFWSDVLGGHFFTVSEAEKNNVIANLPAWAYEGPQWSAFDSFLEGTLPVYRFWSDQFLSHFFTINEAEKDHIISNYSEWSYEGVAWFAFDVSYPETQPIFRFWSDVFQSHFYTSNLAERDYIIENFWEWRYEGIAWYTPIQRQTRGDPIQLEMLRLVNEVRSTGYDCGPEGVFGPTQSLTWDDALAATAARHSNDMSQADMFDHTGSDGTTVADRALDAGYDFHVIGENIAAGYVSVSEVHSAWLSSPGHCANIMNPLFEEFGSALRENPQSFYGTYWTQVFGTPF